MSKACSLCQVLHHHLQGIIFLILWYSEMVDDGFKVTQQVGARVRLEPAVCCRTEYLSRKGLRPSPRSGVLGDFIVGIAEAQRGGSRSHGRRKVARAVVVELGCRKAPLGAETAPRRAAGPAGLQPFSRLPPRGRSLLRSRRDAVAAAGGASGPRLPGLREMQRAAGLPALRRAGRLMSCEKCTAGASEHTWSQISSV